MFLHGKCNAKLNIISLITKSRQIKPIDYQIERE